MADVRRPPPRPKRQHAGTGGGSGGRGGPDDRGQLFLVGALSLAVLFVGFALLLNTAIYTENLATRNTDPGTDPSISYRTAAEDATREIMIRENRNGTDPTWEQKTTWFHAGVEAWSDSAGLHAARHARVVSVTVDSQNGTRFEQTDASRNLTNRNYAEDWQLGNDPAAVRDASLTVSSDSLAERNLTNLFLFGSNPFAVEFEDTDGGDEWHVYVYDTNENGVDDVTVAVDDGSSEQKCTHVGSAARIDISNGSINGTDCPAFDLLDLPDDAVDDEDIRLRFENGNLAKGTYEIKVAEGADVSGNVYDNEATGDHDNGAAFATAIIYEADVTITYESTDISYQTTVRIAPEEIR